MASPPLTNREYAYFTVTGKGDSSLISSILKIESTKNWSEGENNPRNNTPRKFMRWNLESGLDDTQSIDLHIEKLLSVLEPLALELAELSTKYEVYIQCVGYFPPPSHGLHLDRKVIERISRLSVSLDYDFYFVSDNGHDLDYC